MVVGVGCVFLICMLVWTCFKFVEVFNGLRWNIQRDDACLLFACLRLIYIKPFSVIYFRWCYIFIIRVFLILCDPYAVIWRISRIRNWIGLSSWVVLFIFLLLLSIRLQILVSFFVSVCSITSIIIYISWPVRVEGKRGINCCIKVLVVWCIPWLRFSLWWLLWV